MDYEATSLYPSAKWDENSSYPRIETDYAYTRNMNEKLVEKFHTGNFTRGSAILKIICNIPKTLIFQNFPVKERVNEIEINCMRKV